MKEGKDVPNLRGFSRVHIRAQWTVLPIRLQRRRARISPFGTCGLDMRGFRCKETKINASMTVPSKKRENRANQKATRVKREACCIQAASSSLDGVQGAVARSLMHGVKCLPFRELFKSERKLPRFPVPQDTELKWHLGNQRDCLDFSRP
jgi:hypothetical protein